MRRAGTEQRGFSLIELLTVIAIIAVLGAIITPMSVTMRERGNQTECISNLQSIGQALKLYRLDERAYPPALYGYLEEGSTEPTTFLYPQYVRSLREFKCPDNPNRFTEATYSPPFAGNSADTGVPQERTTAASGYALKPVTAKRIVYYLFDSYDGAILPPRSRPTPTNYQVHYRRDWSSILEGPTVTSPNNDRELLDRNPEDSTYVTACTYHRQYVGANALPQTASSMDMVLFLDGHAEKQPSYQVVDPASANRINWKATPR